MPSKFYNITFPLIGLEHSPFDYYIRTDSIGIKLSEQSDWLVLDKITKGQSLISRYIANKPDKFLSDATCLNLTHLISKRICWAIDSEAKVHNLSYPEKFKARSVQVVRTKEDLIWVDTVSYPFKLKKMLIDPEIILEQYATIVYIDNEWVLYKFTSFKQELKEITL